MDDKVPYFETNPLSSLYKHFLKIDHGAFLTSNPYNDFVNIHVCLCLFKVTITFLLNDQVKGYILAPGALQVLKYIP